MAIKIERGSLTIEVGSKDELLYVIEAFDELDQRETREEPKEVDRRTPNEVPTVEIETEEEEPLAEPASLSGVPITECGVQILRDNDNVPMHYRDIASQAMSRGYVGRNADPDSTRRSFDQTLRRDERFEVTDPAMFRLANHEQDE